MTPELETKYVFTLTVHIGGVTTAGETGHGVRRIIPIIGGTVKGEGINGKVCPPWRGFSNHPAERTDRAGGEIRP